MIKLRLSRWNRLVLAMEKNYVALGEGRDNGGSYTIYMNFDLLLNKQKKKKVQFLNLNYICFK